MLSPITVREKKAWNNHFEVRVLWRFYMTQSEICLRIQETCRLSQNNIYQISDDHLYIKVI